jgi:hypothetical protein
MAKFPDTENFEPTEPLTANAESWTYDRSPERNSNDEANESSFASAQVEGTDVGEVLNIGIWKSAEPQYCKAICAHYGVKSRTVQKWLDKILEACPWFELAELRLPDDRYTPLCIELMGDYRASRLIARKWGAKIAERFADRISESAPSWAEIAVSKTEVLPPESDAEEEFDEFYMPDLDLTIVPTRKIKTPSTADDFDFGSALEDVL